MGSEGEGDVKDDFLNSHLGNRVDDGATQRWEH